MFHCFKISKHISISALFFIISLSCFVGVLCCLLKNNCPGGRVFQHNLSSPGFGISHFLCAGESVLSKNSPQVCRGGGGRGLFDGYITCYMVCVLSCNQGGDAKQLLSENCPLQQRRAPLVAAETR